MSVERIITDILTEGEADIVKSRFEREGCTATKERQPDGKWTVRATCPEKDGSK